MTSAWRIADTIAEPAKGTRVFMSSVCAPGSNDVWAVGGTITSTDQSFPVLKHWDGRAWKSVMMPSSFTGFPFAPYQVAASSATDVWVFTSAGTPKTQAPSGRWAHWNGRSWTTGTLPAIHTAGNSSPAVTVTAAASSGPHDVWVGWTVTDWNSKFGTPAGAVLAHFDGTSWHTYRFPGELPNIVGISALSSTDVWADVSGAQGTGGVGLVSTSRNELLHWNGSSLREIAAPRGVVADAVAGQSARDAWITGDVPGKGPDHLTFVAGAAHWNGTRWTITTDPAADASFEHGAAYVDVLTSATSDGQGGLWAVAQAYPAIASSLPGAASLWHYADGRWTGTSLSSLGNPSLFQLARAPGTGDIWAAGAAVPGRSSAGGYPVDGSILRYQN